MLRDLLVTTIAFSVLPFCLTQPWVGILLWSWIGYMNPHQMTWSFAREIPFAQLAAIATFAGMFLTAGREPRRIPWERETWLLLLFWGIVTGTTILALYPDEAWPQLEKVSKILLLTFVTMMLFQRVDRLRYLFLTVALSLGFFGFKGGIWAILTGGVHRVEGPGGSFIGGNTELGLALNMTLPFLFYLAREESRPWLKILLRAVFACSVIAVVFTYSRGALLGLPIVLTLLLLRARHRVIGVIVLGAAVTFVTMFAPPQWFARLETIQEYEQEQSASARLVAWRVAWELALDRPLTGGGFWVLPHNEVFEQYAPGYNLSHSAHSIYFSVLGDHGFPGLIVFVGLIVSCLVSLHRLRREVAERPDAAQLRSYSEMLEVSLLAYAVSGAFLTQAYFDLFYHLVSFVVLLKVLARQEEAPAPATAPAKAMAPRPVVVAGTWR